ncbi:VPLPA-CTERM sorting domain-containing protein [Albimonas sp. CAU 1670]|uniref:VPLPA-CTERM sorting domain-containing protein n=1 Tax=Albimonas sp. CAU 1670 TaxID=3032599 RepID=UPI0023DBEF60|nr:VPLPA-CTERM sorting domain-containing protein [Albimonas sp. CAU 1670]MDF2232616.1 VPLPA-CTERM sorting domain-containing protein [Albimonas sp. CAU 1670]
MKAAAVAVIDAGDIASPYTEDFNSAPVGTIGISDPIFSALGIVSITGTLDSSDTYDPRTFSSRALTLNSGGDIVLIDPGAFGLLASVTLTFAAPITEIGIGWHDQGGTVAASFLLGANPVDSYSGSDQVLAGEAADLAHIAFRTTNAFDTFTFSIGGSGFALDDITVSGVSASVPLPAAAPLVLTGLGALVGVSARRRRRRSA